MDLQQLKKSLAAEAKAAGICDEWYNYILDAPGKPRLLALYYGGFDFVKNNDYPSEPLRREFDDIRKHYNIFEGEHIDKKNPKRLVAYKGTTGCIAYDGYGVGQIWVRPGAELEVTAEGNSYVTIDVAEGATVAVYAKDCSRIAVFMHGGNVKQRREGNAIITNY